MLPLTAPSQRLEQDLDLTRESELYTTIQNYSSLLSDVMVQVWQSAEAGGEFWCIIHEYR